jgi:hypothetical protein
MRRKVSHLSVSSLVSYEDSVIWPPNGTVSWHETSEGTIIIL